MEKFMFIAFRSREHTVKFFEEMRSRGIVGTVINTPREAEAGCGLSSAKSRPARILTETL